MRISSQPSVSPDESDRAGFALAEVLVAFAILALVSLAMLRAFGGSMDVVRAVELRVERLALAQDLLEGVRARPVLAAGRQEGRERDLAWRVEIEEVAARRDPARPRPVRVTVSVAADRRTPVEDARFDLRTIVLARAGDD